MLDVGCGIRPYEWIFEEQVSEYVGVDSHAGAGVDVIAQAEALPFEDASFDCLLCSQVLEHANDPYAAMREAWRVLRPGGVAFVSTHGVTNYHPNPDDYWRWTHTGLARLFDQTGAWAWIEVVPNGGTASALGYLLGRQAEAVAAKAGVEGALSPGVLLLNVLVWNLDRLYRRAYPDRPPDLSSNYLAIGVRAAAVT